MVQALGWLLLAEALQAEGGAECGERVEMMNFVQYQWGWRSQKRL